MRQAKRSGLLAAAAALALLAGMAGTGAGAAAEPLQRAQGQDWNKEAEDAARAARQALEQIMRALGGVLSNIPQYEAPEILPNGDIIIRRVPREAPSDPRPPEPGRRLPEPGGDDIET